MFEVYKRKQNVNRKQTFFYFLQGARITTLESDVTTLKTSVSTLETKVTALETSVSKLQTDVTSLQTSLTSLQSDVTSLQVINTNFFLFSYSNIHISLTYTKQGLISSLILFQFRLRYLLSRAKYRPWNQQFRLIPAKLLLNRYH